jgi:hypothetical protein
MRSASALREKCQPHPALRPAASEGLPWKEAAPFGATHCRKHAKGKVCSERRSSESSIGVPLSIDRRPSSGWSLPAADRSMPHTGARMPRPSPKLEAQRAALRRACRAASF